MKFTGRGGRVLVSLERVNSHLEITVNDTGRGIAPEFLPHVFDRFRQEDASITRKVGGLGLGLSIVKHLVELHGGSVRASSPGVDRGATFVVSLPMLGVAGVDEDQAGVSAHPRAVSHAAHPRLDEGADLQGVRVLVVDDDAETGELVQRLLESRGAVVSAVTSAAEGRRVLAAARPDVIVSDIGMPGEDGFEFIRGLRRLPGDQGGGIPAVALTAFARAEDKTRTLLAGFQLHLAKPVDPFELIAAVASVSGRIVC